MRKHPVTIIAVLIIILCLPAPAHAQQYKLKQVSNMMGMKSESTIYVKGMRKRTEGGMMIMGMGGNIATIEQCDLQRYIKINDKKKLYFIEPFAKGNENEEVIDEDNKKDAMPPKQNKLPNQKGGIINMWYNITDTGERKKMYGITARHVWTSQKIKPSPDACSMKDSILIKTDGWYIDLPQFNCPVHYRPMKMRPNEKVQPDCMDRFITHRRGKGKLGFPLTETTTIIMGSGASTEMQTSIETLDFFTGKLDSMLFEIPPGYQLAKTEDELQDKMDVNEMLKNAMKGNNQNTDIINNEVKKAGGIRIGVFAPTGDSQVQPVLLQQHMVSTVTGGTIEGVAVTSDDEARKYNCDYTLNAAFTTIKSAGKLGGLLKAIKNADPNAASSFNIQGNLTLKKLSDGTVVSQPDVNGKYDGKIDDAAGKALDDGCRTALKALK